MYQKINLQNRSRWLWGIGLGILFPLFFQLSGGIYRDVDLMLDSQGVLAKLPLPFSVLTCLATIVLLAGSQGRTRPAFLMLFGMIAVSSISFLLGGDGATPPQRKLIMIMQVILPLAGLLLGQLVDDTDKIIARAFLAVLSIVVPLQLLATWLQGSERLTHYLYAFSIYSHWQYVPVIFVCAFAYSLTSLWNERKLWLCVLTILMFVYVTRSYSFLTIFAYVSLMVSFVVYRLWPHRANSKWVLMPLALIAVVALGGLAYFTTKGESWASSLFLGKFTELAQGNIPGNVQERFNDWKFFGSGIVESKKTLLVGHPEPMPRNIRTSPHNWYIDMAYNFGLVALLPIVMLIGYTAYACYRQRKALAAETWWLAAIVFYLIVIDSNFKVTLRQPYPGIFAYFMWGLLLSRLRSVVLVRAGT